MRIVWDEPKRLANIDRHGIDFRDVPDSFFADARVRPTHSNRFMAIGRLDGRATVVIFAPLGTEAISLISVRAASAAERKVIE